MIGNDLVHWLTNAGNVAYSFALALTPDERTAQRLLQQWVRTLREQPPAVWRDDELITRLYRLALSKYADQPRERRPAPPTASILGPLRTLPLDQRMAVLAYSLLSADYARLAAMLNTSPDNALVTFQQAITALAPALGHHLTQQIQSDACVTVRQALINPTQHLQLFETVRRHLSTCTHCRLFDREWQAVTHELTATLRRIRDNQPLPTRLLNRLLESASAPRQRFAQWALLIPPLVLIILILTLILPGLLRNPLTVVTTGAAEPGITAGELVNRALVHGGIPEPEGPPIWYARYQTIWYFNNRTIAPLFAEIWHDRDNPARHRLQLRHIEGGAPYEFQLGDGTRRFYYALDGSYAPTLYGDLPIRAAPNEPELVVSLMSAEQQQAAFFARRQTGPWRIVPSYLQQAAEAPDLRLLGQQRIGNRLAYIVSFRGFSPLDLPAEAAEPVMVLMTIAGQDGHVLSITELVGPPGGTQTSRVVWRLAEFNWLVSSEQIRDAFTFERAWNGRAEAEGSAPQPLIDPSWPLLRRANVIEPAQLARVSEPFVLPATIPVGIEQAVLLQLRGSTMNGVLYTGRNKRLILTFDRIPDIDSTVPTEVIDRWRVRIEPVRGQRYRVAIEPDSAPGNAGTRIALDTQGFTIDELRAVIASLQPVYQIDLTTQQAFFVSTATVR
ncbi:MAG: anti-sigma factor [Chloroflexus sp.]|nr:anti-sigma factor [Chloroflexus sp.]